MKKGISIWSFRGKTYEEAFNMAKEAGFDGVELALDEKGEITLESTKEDMLKLKKKAEAAGLEMFSVASSVYWRYPISSNDESIRQKAIAFGKKQVDIAAWTGCDTVLIVPAIVNGEGDKFGDIPYDVAYDRALEGMKEICRYAETYKIFVGIENVWNKFLLSPLEMKRFIEEIGSSSAAAYIDVGNILQVGYPEHWIKILGSQIKKVHFKDFKNSTGNITGFVDLLSGDVNYPAVMKAFREIGYDGWVTAELGAYKYYPDYLIQTASKSMDLIINS